MFIALLFCQQVKRRALGLVYSIARISLNRSSSIFFKKYIFIKRLKKYRMSD